MSFVNYNKCKILINQQTILAENATIESQNSLEPNHALGKKSPGNLSPNGPTQSRFSFSYFVETNKEPSFNEYHRIRHLTNPLNISGVTMEIAGITGYNCLLESLNYKISPSQIIKGTVSYITWDNLSGNISANTGFLDYTTGTLAHGWNTFLVNSGNKNPQMGIYDLDFSVRNNWLPIFKLGKKTPTQVNLLNGQEKIALTTDTYLQPSFTGEDPTIRLINTNGEIPADYSFLYVYGVTQIFYTNPPCGQSYTPDTIYSDGGGDWIDYYRLDFLFPFAENSDGICPLGPNVEGRVKYKHPLGYKQVGPFNEEVYLYALTTLHANDELLIDDTLISNINLGPLAQGTVFYTLQSGQIAHLSLWETHGYGTWAAGFIGVTPTRWRGQDKSLKINPINYICNGGSGININLAGFKITNSSVNASIDSNVKSVIELNREF